MSFEPRDYLGHILIEADYLVEQSEGLSFEDFAADETRRRAFVRSLETVDCGCPRIATTSQTHSSPAQSTLRMRRRVGSASMVPRPMTTRLQHRVSFSCTSVRAWR